MQSRQGGIDGLSFDHVGDFGEVHGPDRQPSSGRRRRDKLTQSAMRSALMTQRWQSQNVRLYMGLLIFI
jgi:hypothetical protein